MKQGDIINVTIAGLNSEGEGIARAGDGGFVLFVPGVLPGESAEVRIVLKKKNYGVAKALRRFCDSPSRVTPRCPLFGRCGGCQLQHISYEAQLAMKKRTVADALARVGGFPAPPVDDCVPSPSEWRYRNKASLPVQARRGENFAAGFYRPRSHDIVPYRGCPVLLPSIDEGLREIASSLRAAGLRGAAENDPLRSGLIRHIVMREARFTGEKLCAVVIARAPSEKEREALARAASRVRGLSGLVCNINPNPGNFIWGGETLTISGSPVITEKLGGFSFDFEASSFFQVNSEQAEALYRRAASFAAPGKESEVLELYAGVGALTAFLAESARRVTAVESWLPAAKHIKHNAAKNGLDNIVALTAKAEEMPDGTASRRFDVVALDPPRSGCDEKVIEMIREIAPERVVYVSCNPATLARDAKRLAESGYLPRAATPFDMFPQTSHVETVVLMSRVRD